MLWFILGALTGIAAVHSSQWLSNANNRAKISKFFNIKQK